MDPSSNAVDTHSRVNSRWQNVLPEILAKICEYLVPNFLTIESARKLKRKPSGVYGPLIGAGSVCQHWRQTICSTPSLWASLHILPDDSEPVYTFLEWQIERATGHPLHITASGNSGEFSRRTLNLILSKRKHWGSFDMFVTLASMATLFPAHAYMPKLQHLELWMIRPPNSVEFVTPSCAPLSIQGNDAPSLTEVVLHYPTAIPRVSLPWSQLRRFVLLTDLVDFTSSGYTFPTLSLLKNVQSLALCWSIDGFSTNNSQERIELPQLRHLDLQLYTTERLHVLLEQLNLISIQAGTRLDLWFSSVSVDELGLINQSSLPFSLTKLALGKYQSPSVDRLVPILRNLPLLVHLAIFQGNGVNVDVLLQELRQDQQFLPDLEEFTVAHVRFTFRTFLDMLDSRVSRTTVPVADRKPLRRVKIENPVGVKVSRDDLTSRSPFELFRDEHTHVKLKLPRIV